MQSVLPAALAITTTDRYPKVRSTLSRTKKWRIVGIAKGAGMIEPNMAVMMIPSFLYLLIVLIYITSDSSSDHALLHID